MEKDLDKRIRQLMESQHLNQQAFANITGIPAATLCNIFSQRTRPTLPHVQLLLKSFPNINPYWLLYGDGEMFVGSENAANLSADVEEKRENEGVPGTQPTTDKMAEPLDMFSSIQPKANVSQNFRNVSGVNNQVNHQQSDLQTLAITAKRKITEIRVFYDDQTYESFTPKK